MPWKDIPTRNMARYIQDYKKIVWGYFEVKDVDSLEEAKEKFDKGDYEEYDNKSDYETEEWQED